MKRRDVGGNIFALIIIRREAFIARAGKMNDLERLALQRGQRFDDGLIDSGGALAAAHHQHRAQVFAQSEFSPRRPAIDPLQIGADRRAGDFRARPSEKIARIP